jgi:hypothetical protein
MMRRMNGRLLASAFQKKPCGYCSEAVIALSSTDGAYPALPIVAPRKYYMMREWPLSVSRSAAPAPSMKVRSGP